MVFKEWIFLPSKTSDDATIEFIKSTERPPNSPDEIDHISMFGTNINDWHTRFRKKPPVPVVNAIKI
jgi:hypothetical protein